MKNILIFIAGAGIGSVVTWKLLEKKYKKIADDEIESVVEHYKEKQNEIISNLPVDLIVDNEKNQITEEISTSYNDIKNNIIDGNVKVIKPPYIITPEEFGETDYITKSYILYTDGTLADEKDKPLYKDINETFGEGNLDKLGEYEEDSVYIRDDYNEIDYEILKSEKDFSEIFVGSTDN